MAQDNQQGGRKRNYEVSDEIAIELAAFLRNAATPGKSIRVESMDQQHSFMI